MSKLQIRKQLIQNTPFKNGTSNKRKFITIHMTGNYTLGANAQAHANLQSNGNSRDAAWHWQVDDKVAIQSFDHKFQLWQSRDGGGNGNNHSIAIEICVNRDGNYRKALENAIKLVKHIMTNEKISIYNVVQHNKWSGKHCPRELRNKKDGFSWDWFIGEIILQNKPSTVTPSKPTTPSNQHYTGDSIVTYLQTIGVDSSYANRKKLAEQNGITSYRGSAAQNIKLLNILRSGGQPITYAVGSVVKVKNTATKYATGQNIASFVKGNSYKIIQKKSDRVLLGGINSWVYLKDLE